MFKDIIEKLFLFCCCLTILISFIGIMVLLGNFGGKSDFFEYLIDILGGPLFAILIVILVMAFIFFFYYALFIFTENLLKRNFPKYFYKLEMQNIYKNWVDLYEKTEINPQIFLNEEILPYSKSKIIESYAYKIKNTNTDYELENLWWSLSLLFQFKNDIKDKQVLVRFKNLAEDKFKIYFNESTEEYRKTVEGFGHAIDNKNVDEIISQIEKDIDKDVENLSKKD